MTLDGGELIRKIPLESNIKIVPGISKMVVFLSPNAEMWGGEVGSLQKNGPAPVEIAFKEANPGSSLRKKITIGSSVTIE